MLNRNQALYRYKTYIKESKKLSELTTNRRISNVLSFFDFIDAEGINLNSLKNDDIYNFINKLQSNKYTQKTINSKLVAIREFLNFLLLHERCIEKNVALEVPLFKIKDRMPQVIPNNELKLLLNYMLKHKHSYKLITITLLSTELGLHLREIFDLKISNIDLKNKKVKIHRDNNEFIFPITNELFLNISNYLLIRSSLNPGTEFLFVSELGTPFSVRSYQLDFKNILIETGIEENYTPRNLRSTFLKNMATINQLTVPELKEVSNQSKIYHYYGGSNE